MLLLLFFFEKAPNGDFVQPTNEGKRDLAAAPNTSLLASSACSSSATALALPLPLPPPPPPPRLRSKISIVSAFRFLASCVLSFSSSVSMPVPLKSIALKFPRISLPILPRILIPRILSAPQSDKRKTEPGRDVGSPEDEEDEEEEEEETSSSTSGRSLMLLPRPRS